MDRPDADPEQLRRSLAYIRRINLLLGYTRSMLFHLERFSRTWPSGQTMRIIDLATGSADLPVAILRWADQNRKQVQVVGLDLHAETARSARAASNDPRLQIVQADALHPPFGPDSFDYATTSMFLHHLDDGSAQHVLRVMARLARRGIIAGDILRHRRAYAWITLFSLCANPMVRHDARVSVAQAFTREEVLAMRDRAGLTFVNYYRHFGHRFVLAGEK